MKTTECAIIGAGPYGLSAASHLRDAGVEVRVFGHPMSFWRSMPAGMLLRSNWTATSMVDHRGPHSLDVFRDETGRLITKPIPLDTFIRYGDWVQERVAPDVARRAVIRIDRAPDGFRLVLEGGDRLHARRVVVACGIAPFASRPHSFDALPSELASHTSEHATFSRFGGRSVLVIGGGQSALEAAALLHEEGATVEVLVRSDTIHWLHGGKYHRMLGRFAPLVYAPTDVGPMGLSRVVAATDAFRRLPRRVQDPIARRSIRPAGAAWLVSRLGEVPIRLCSEVRSARPQRRGLLVELEDGTVREVDHLMFGTGYRIDITRYGFIPTELMSQIRRADGYPILGRGLESSVPRLHFLGAPAAWSFGPTMRFVSGSWYAGRALARSAVRSRTDNEERVGAPTTRPVHPRPAGRGAVRHRRRVSDRSATNVDDRSEATRA